MPARVLFTLFACVVGVAGLRAADPPVGASVSHADLDRVAIEVLKDLHNRGADLYNAADAAAAVRVYETTLRAVGPFLAHRPKAQAAIADGLVEALKLDGAKAQAYRLHEVIDQVRTDLKAGAKPDDPKQEVKKPEEKQPEPPAVGSLGGVLTLDGMPLMADITLVSLTLPQPRVFTATTDADGKFSFPAELPTATYAVMVTGGAKPVPARYQSTMTSGVEVVVKAGSQTSNVELQSK